MLELIGQILLMLTAVVLAQFGPVQGGAREEAPSIQRTVSRSAAEPSAERRVEAECEQEATLHSV